MSRLIDADDFWARLPRNAENITLADITEALGGTPTVDAKPVRHAHWELRIVPPVFVCSWCREESDVKFDYCPHCGADMREQFSREEGEQDGESN